MSESTAGQKLRNLPAWMCKNLIGIIISQFLFQFLSGWWKKKSTFPSVFSLVQLWDSDGAHPSALRVWATGSVLGISGSSGHRWRKCFGAVRWCSTSLSPWDLPMAPPVAASSVRICWALPCLRITWQIHLVTLHEPAPPLVFSSFYIWHQAALLSENCGVLVCLKPSGSVQVLLTALSCTGALASCSQQAQFEPWQLGIKIWFCRKHQIISNNRFKYAVSSANKGD